jgi:hypothetical protein
MKLKKYLLFLSGFVWINLACERELQEYYVEPKADFELSASQVNLFESLDIVNLSEGQQFTLFSGDEGHNYDSTANGDRGITPNNGRNFAVSYYKPGTYTLTMVASGYHSNAKESVIDILQKEIVVIDTNRTITDVRFADMFSMVRLDRDLIPSFRILGQDGLLEGTNISVEIYNHSIILDPDRKAYGSPAEAVFKPNFLLNTDYSEIEIEGNGIIENNKTFVDFTDGTNFVPRRVTVRSESGESKDYSICLLQIPMFKTIQVGGFTGFVTFDFADFNKSYVDLKVPAETDLSALVATFTTYQEGVETKVGDEIQESGVTVNDFTEPVLYKLQFSQPGFENIFSVSSEVLVSLTKE